VDDASRRQRLVVEAQDGARLDRRYVYRATDSMGGAPFENAKAVRARAGAAAHVGARVV
jgi:hypothetical protein